MPHVPWDSPFLGLSALRALSPSHTCERPSMAFRHVRATNSFSALTTLSGPPCGPTDQTFLCPAVVFPFPRYIPLPSALGSQLCHTHGSVFYTSLFGFSLFLIFYPACPHAALPVNMGSLRRTCLRRVRTSCILSWRLFTVWIQSGTSF